MANDSFRGRRSVWLCQIDPCKRAHANDAIVRVNERIIANALIVTGLDQGGIVLSMAGIHISEADAARDFPALLARVRRRGDRDREGSLACRRAAHDLSFPRAPALHNGLRVVAGREAR